MTLPYDKSHIGWDELPADNSTFWDYVAAERRLQKQLVLTASFKRNMVFRPIAAMKLKKLKP